MNAYEYLKQGAIVPVTMDAIRDLVELCKHQAKELDEAGHMIGVLREYISDLEKGLESSIKLNKAQAERNNEQ